MNRANLGGKARPEDEELDVGTTKYLLEEKMSHS